MSDEGILKGPDNEGEGGDVLRKREERKGEERKGEERKENKVLIIAEAGLNHNGKVDIGLKLVEEAKRVGADIIKFQSYKAEDLVSKGAKAQYELLKRYELTHKSHEVLQRHCKEVGIEFMSSPFDRYHVDMLEGLGVSRYKVASSELTNHPLLEYISKQGKEVLLSTGLASIYEIEEGISCLEKNLRREQIVLLHCVSLYPTPYNRVNLEAIQTLKRVFKLGVGYSDHSQDIWIPIGAIGFGARYIEKHFTLDRGMEGPDHNLSLDVNGFKQMVEGIRAVEAGIGDGIKRAMKEEKKVRQMARRSLTSIKRIKRGSVVSDEMLCLKRPGHGIPYKFKDIVLGKKTKREITEDTLLLWEDFF